MPAKIINKQVGPREKLIERGARYLSDAELLAIFLRVGYSGKSVMTLANELVDEYGLGWLLSSPMKDFCRVKGLGKSHYVQFQAVMELAQRYLHDVMKRQTDVIESSEAMKSYLVHLLGAQSNEVFACVFLDNRHRVIRFERLFYGTVDFTPIFPREIIRKALELNCAALVIAHNHPSGLVDPSKADKDMTITIKKACSLVDICLLDHIIVSGTRSLSFAEEGLI